MSTAVCQAVLVRSLLTSFFTSNPTWIREANEDDAAVSLTATDLRRAFKKEVKAMARSKNGHVGCATHTERAPVLISVASSTLLPDADGSASSVISSPPYCTRIDYAVATRPELAVLGANAVRLRTLRDAMIGSATIPSIVPDVREDWGSTCKAFLKKVASHKSHGSRNYYWKTHRLYFDGIFRSLSEINRVLRPGGDCVLVVQDSYYKEVHNDLPRVIEEMADSLGWAPKHRYDYVARMLMSRVNPGSKAYRTKTGAVESVLHFTTCD